MRSFPAPGGRAIRQQVYLGICSRTGQSGRIGCRSAGVVLAAALLAASKVASAQVCSPSGNTYWNFTAASSVTHATLGDPEVYITAGSILSRVDRATGDEIGSRTFSGVALGRPLFFKLKNSIGFPTTDNLLVSTARTNAYVYGLHPTSLVTYWSRGLQRPAYAGDEVRATPVAQTWESSDPAFRVLNKDLVMVGTYYDATTTANRVYGLDAATGNIVWLFNPTGGFICDAIHGLTVDYARNTVYVVSDAGAAGTQNTVWGLSTINGAKKWSVALGAVEATPVLKNGRLYVATRAGTLYALDPDDGSTIWSTTVSSGETITYSLVADVMNGTDVRLYVVSGAVSGGTIHAYVDHCPGWEPLWTYRPTSAVVTAPPAVFGGFLYAGANDGKTYQVRASDGVAQAWATVSAFGAEPSWEPIAIRDSYGTAQRLLARSSSTMKYLCIPWPDTPGDKAFRIDPRKLGPGEAPVLLGSRALEPDPARPAVPVESGGSLEAVR